MSILNTGVRHVRNVQRYVIGAGSSSTLPEILKHRRSLGDGVVVFFVDSFFKNIKDLRQRLGVCDADLVLFVSSESEPTTDYIDDLVDGIRRDLSVLPITIVGMGGGCAMDIAKAASNLLTNGGRAQDYQGWDLVVHPGVYKIAVPTLSGTGAEATRTCVMTNLNNGLKLGMNSDHTVFDEIVMDPELTGTVPRDQYFYSGMDAYIHCVEALAGSYRNAIGDAQSHATISLCREVFLSNDMMTLENREKLMVASYLGGCAIATSYVGLVHPLSAGLSVVLGLHHCIANCIVMRSMERFYPDAYREFWMMAERQNVEIPNGLCKNLTEAQYAALYHAATVHQKPLTNALGEDYANILTPELVTDLYRMM
jgi:3-deoxy-alpha-D-manno-octulosonate 8-oxidase